MSGDAAPQLLPEAGKQSVTEAVIADLRQREEYGKAKYGTSLFTHNGRDARVDLYQELLDAVQYVKQDLLERPPLVAPDNEPTVFAAGVVIGAVVAMIVANLP